MRPVARIILSILLLSLTAAAQSVDWKGEEHDAIRFLKLLPKELKPVRYNSHRNSLLKTESAIWSSMGPQPVNMLFNGVSSGRVASVAVDPMNSSVIYAAAAGGGLWKSTDAGGHWTPLTDDLPRLSSGSVAVDPQDDNIIYYGQGELHFSLDSYPGSGFYESTDGGMSWTQITLPGALYYTGKVVVAPSNDSVVYACGYYDIYRTSDRGQTWNELNLTPVDHSGNAGAVQDCDVDPTNANIVYATKGSQYANPSDTSYGVFKSTDGGSTWSRASSGLPSADYVDRICIAVAPSSHFTLYCGIYGKNPSKPSSDTTRAFKSTDGGSTWSPMNITVDYGGGQGWYNNTVAVDPTNANIVYLGGVDLWKSTDGGATWGNITNSYSGGTVHPDQHSVSFVHGSGNFYVGDDGGVWKTTDGGSTFTSCNADLDVTQFYALGIDPENSSLTFAGAQDNGTEKNSTPNLDWNEIYSGDGGYVMVDPTNSGTIYVEYVNGALARTTDNGAQFKDIVSGITEDGYWTTPYLFDPHNSNILYTATDRVYRTTNQGTLWKPISTPLKTTSDLVTTMSISPVEPNVIYAGISGYRGDDGGGSFLYVSEDSGQTWTNITIDGDSSNDFARVTADPTQKGVAYLAMLQSPEVMKTTDYGATWTAIGSTSNGFLGEPTKYVYVDSTTGFIYVGAYDGLYFSSNDGTSWSKLGTGLPDAVVDDIAIQYGSKSLRVATHGRGVWQVDLTTGVAEPEPGPASFALSQNYPNPFNPSTVIRYQLSVAGQVSLEVFNILGEKVRTLVDEKEDQGEHSINFNASNLPSGVYFYRLTAGRQSQTRKLILLK